MAANFSRNTLGGRPAFGAPGSGPLPRRGSLPFWNGLPVADLPADFLATRYAAFWVPNRISSTVSQRLHLWVTVPGNGSNPVEGRTAASIPAPKSKSRRLHQHRIWEPGAKNAQLAE